MKQSGLKHDILKELDFRSNTMNTSSFMDGSNYDSTKTDKHMPPLNKYTNMDKPKYQSKNQVLSDLVGGICSKDDLNPHDKGNPISLRPSVVKIDPIKPKVQNSTIEKNSNKSKHQLNAGLLISAIVNVGNENTPTLNMSSRQNSKGSLNAVNTPKPLNVVERESKENIQRGSGGLRSSSGKLTILMPKNLHLTHEQVAFLSNLQNSLDVVGQMKESLDDSRKMLEQANRDLEISRGQSDQLRQEIRIRDESIASLKLQASRVVEDRNLLAIELAAVKQQPLEHQSKADRLEKECASLRAKNKKLVIDQHVLQEIVKEMVFEKEQHLNNSSFHHRDAKCLSEIELLYQRTDPEQNFSSRQTDLYHSFGDAGIQLHNS